MQKELDPKVGVAAIVGLVLIIAVLAYFMFRPAKSFDITKVKGHPPPGWQVPGIPATADPDAPMGAEAGRPGMGGPPGQPGQPR